jgi:hypothetical protein
MSEEVIEGQTGFVMREVDPETFELSLNGERLITLNHDDDGWQGIDRAQHLIRKVAEILKIPFSEE